jgi:diacylglycerol kinase family enzyme
VLGEERLDLGEAGAGPVLEPGFAQVVLDLMEAALTHNRKYRHAARTAPWAERLIRGAMGPSRLARSLGAFLLINPRSGEDSPSAEELAAEAEALGIEAHVMQEGEDLVELARGAEADKLGMAGGDGSLAPVAEVALGRDVPFVSIPFGTRNHFARDLGLDRDDPIGALRAFDGTERRIDVGRANERLFLNNVSLGLYARLVHRREHHRRRRETLARIRAWAIVVTHREHLGITIDGKAAETRLLLVANNGYVLELPSLGERERLDEGKLHVYVQGGDPPERVGEHFVVDAAAGRLEAAVDGEPEVLKTPIDFRIEPRALRVLVPPGDGD